MRKQETARKMPKTDSDKTKEQLINELVELRIRIAALEALENERLSSARLPDGQEQAGKEVKEHMVRSQGLAVVGKLARGMAHELRNPLGAIKNAAYFLNMALEEAQQAVKDALDILEKNVGRCEKIVNSLHVFANPKPPTLRAIDIRDVLQKALLHASIPENITAVSQLDKSLPTILADPDQLGQVFRNIISNAIQSMPEGGKLVAKIEVARPPWVAVSFADTGLGIQKEHLDKVFDPLFTTKAKGIGLGLALAKTVVEGHGGTVEVESPSTEFIPRAAEGLTAGEMGKGSTFTVKLPSGLRSED
jgi:signal transduction histidine kinase